MSFGLNTRQRKNRWVSIFSAAALAVSGLTAISTPAQAAKVCPSGWTLTTDGSDSCEFVFSADTTTVTVPADVTSIDVLTVGGGGGGGAGAGHENNGGGGGAGGQVQICKGVTVSAGQTLAGHIGAGGAGGVFAYDPITWLPVVSEGGNGGDSYFTIDGGSNLCQSAGGGGASNGFSKTATNPYGRGGAYREYASGAYTTKYAGGYGSDGTLINYAPNGVCCSANAGGGGSGAGGAGTDGSQIEGSEPTRWQGGDGGVGIQAKNVTGASTSLFSLDDRGFAAGGGGGASGYDFTFIDSVYSSTGTGIAGLGGTDGNGTQIGGDGRIASDQRDGGEGVAGTGSGGGAASDDTFENGGSNTAGGKGGTGFIALRFAAPTVTATTLYVVPGAKSVTYGGAAPSYTYTLHTGSASGPTVTPTLTTSPTCSSDYVALDSSTGQVANSPRSISCSGAADSNYVFDYTATASLTITKASSTTAISCPASVVFDGTAQTPCSATVTGAGLSTTTSVQYSNNTNVGTVSVTASFDGDANHEASSASKTLGITKASSTTVINCPASVVFDGTAQTPCTATVTGVGLSTTTTVQHTSNTNAGTASASASFAGDANHEASSASTTFAITKASSTTVINCPASVVFDGTAQTPCTATVTGVGLSTTANVSYANNTNVGSASANATFAGDANHEGSTAEEGSFAITEYQTEILYTGKTLVTPSMSSVNVSASGLPEFCTGTITYSLDVNPLTGQAGAYALTNNLGSVDTTGWLAGDYQITASYAGDGNCASSESTKALAVVEGEPQTGSTSGTTAITLPAPKNVPAGATVCLVDPDTVACGDTVTIASVGTWTLIAGGAVVFTPSAGYVGSNTVLYRVTFDGHNHENAYTVTVTQSARGPVSVTIGYFVDGSPLLTKAIQRKIRAFITKYSDYKNIACEGVTEGPTVLATDKALAKKRALNACRYVVKTLKAKLHVAKVTYKRETRVGDSVRRVRITLSDNRS